METEGRRKRAISLSCNQLRCHNSDVAKFFNVSVCSREKNIEREGEIINLSLLFWL